MTYEISGRDVRRDGPVDEPIDSAVVARLLAGDRSVSPTAAELQEAITRLNRRGWSAMRIALQVGCTRRTVHRQRRRIRMAVTA